MEVDLDGREGLLAALRVGDLQVDLGAVERGLAGRLGVLGAGRVQGRADHPLTLFPGGRVARVLGALTGSREAQPRRRDRQSPIRLLDDPENRRDLALHVLGRAEHVPIVEGHLPHPREAADDARALVAKHGPDLGQPVRELAVGARLGVVDQDVVRTEHRSQHDLLGAEVHRRIHVVVIVGPVTGALIQRALGHRRGADVAVAVAALELGHVTRQLIAHGRAGG